MALKVFYSPLETGETNGEVWEACYMTSNHFIGPHVAARINGKGYLIIVDESTVPQDVAKDEEIEDLGDLETSSVSISSGIISRLNGLDIENSLISTCIDKNQLLTKLFYHKQCKIDIKMIKEKIAAGKSCFMGFKTEEMDF